MHSITTGYTGLDITGLGYTGTRYTGTIGENPKKDQKKPPDILDRIYWTTTTGYDWTGYTGKDMTGSDIPVWIYLNSILQIKIYSFIHKGPSQSLTHWVIIFQTP